jgi:hypothetical protein
MVSPSTCEYLPESFLKGEGNDRRNDLKKGRKMEEGRKVKR